MRIYQYSLSIDRFRIKLGTAIIFAIIISALVPRCENRSQEIEESGKREGVEGGEEDFALQALFFLLDLKMDISCGHSPRLLVIARNFFFPHGNRSNHFRVYQAPPFLISFSHPPSGKVGRINDKLSTNRSFLIWDDSLSFFLRRYLIIQWTIGKRMNFNERSLRFIFIITIMLKYIHTCLLQIMQIQLQDINIRII